MTYQVPLETQQKARDVVGHRRSWRRAGALRSTPAQIARPGNRESLRRPVNPDEHRTKGAKSVPAGRLRASLSLACSALVLVISGNPTLMALGVVALVVVWLRERDR